MSEEPERISIEYERLLTLLAQGELELRGQFQWSSNYTFLVDVKDPDYSIPAVYKPCAGERPLWDFDHATLCHREVAAYLLSEQLGWPAVPPTVLRDGPYGPGSVQLYISAKHEEHFFTLRESKQYDEDWQRIALFDVITNNADRKGGHVLLDLDGQIWAIDHGLTFHEDPKLRTVIWDFAGEPIPAEQLGQLKRFDQQLVPEHPVWQALLQLISADELEMTKLRLEELVGNGTFPEPGPARNVPYPLV